MMRNKTTYLPLVFKNIIQKGGTTVNILKEIAKSKAKEALLADRYSGSKYTFDEAYTDARSKGQKTFFWNRKYYNTNYEGEHGKQYRADAASGKAAAWEQQYPGYTNPELRKEKQEELDTYGITNEQTKNKTWKDKQFRKIPARGYDVNDAISSLRNEHHTYSHYNTPEELIEALRKKYPEFKDVPLSGQMFDSINGPTIELNQDLKKPKDVDEEKWQSFVNDVYKYDRFNRLMGDQYAKEIHRPEYDYLLGWPTSKNELLSSKQLGNNVIISKYRTGNLPYYYTTPLLEYSVPFIPKEYLERGKRNREMWENLDSLYSSLPRPNTEALPERHSWDEYTEANEKDMKLLKNNAIKKQFDQALKERTDLIDYHTDKTYSDSTYRKRWEDLGLSMWRGDGNLDIPTLARSNATSADLDTLEKLGYFNYLEQLPLTPGNRLAGTGNDNYYRTDEDWDLFKGKYDKIIKYLRSKNKNAEDHNKYNGETLNTKNYIFSEPSLGIYTYSVPKDSSYISVWDKFDIDPFGSGNDKPVIKVGKPFEYYTRFYPEGKIPQIDSLYNNFRWNK